REATVPEPVQREPVERKLEQRNIADAIREARAGDLCSTFEIDPAGRQLEMVANGKVKRRRIAPAANLDRVFVRRSIRCGLVGRIRHAGEQVFTATLRRGELLLERLELPFDPLELGELLRRRLALDLARRAQLLDPWLNLANCLIRGEQLVEDFGGSLPREGDAEAVRVVARCAEIDHGRESR